MCLALPFCAFISAKITFFSFLGIFLFAPNVFVQTKDKNWLLGIIRLCLYLPKWNIFLLLVFLRRHFHNGIKPSAHNKACDLHVNYPIWIKNTINTSAALQIKKCKLSSDLGKTFVMNWALDFSLQHFYIKRVAFLFIVTQWSIVRWWAKILLRGEKRV